MRVLNSPSRRSFLQGFGMLTSMAAALPAWAEDVVKLGLPGGPSRRDLTGAFPGKG
jgi:hypothetical protein